MFPEPIMAEFKLHRSETHGKKIEDCYVQTSQLLSALRWFIQRDCDKFRPVFSGDSSAGIVSFL